MEIDCNACKLESGMVATRVPRFSGFVRFIGFIIATPSFIGMLFGAIMAISLDQKTISVGTVSITGFVFLTSAVGGLVGWLLLMKKKVFKCSRCGFILPRD